MAGYKPVKALNPSKKRHSARISSEEANETDEDNSNAEGDLFSKKEER